MWSATITSVSNINSGGFVDLTYDITVDGQILFSKQSVSTKADSYQNVILQNMADLKTQYDQAQNIKVGIAVTLLGPVIQTGEVVKL